LPLEFESTKFINVILGVFPASFELDSLIEKLAQEVEHSMIEILNKDKDQQYAVLIYHKSVEEEFLKIVRQYSFSRIIFKDLTGTVLKNISAVEKQIEEINRNKEILINDIVKFSDSLDKIKLYYDSLLIKRDKSRVRERILKTQKTFYIDGWVIKSEALRIEKLLLSFDCVVMISDPDDGEEYPILLKNNSFSTAHESITELYSLPYYKNLDPTLFWHRFTVYSSE
jgi:V/A-type H+-transporting ATPase subunit I